jgi:dTDP-4-amino-4,6-dideoxygalactose transaminase
MIPFLDLKAQYESIREEIQSSLTEVLESTAFAGGPFVSQFEKEFAGFCQCHHAMGLGSGTDALWLTLLALGIGPGDEVITVPNTFIATAEAISFTGATPVFVDVDENTYNMDPGKLIQFLEQNCSRAVASGQLVNQKTNNVVRAVIPVHLFGQMADMDSIIEIAKANNLRVIEDACQAHGAEYKSKRAGSVGDAGCFSFYPGKNLGAYGEAGAVVTNDSDLAGRIKVLRDHGQPTKYHHSHIGWNARMDGFQGAVLSVKLKHLEAWNEARRKSAQRYNELLDGCDGIVLPRQADDAKHVYHVYSIRVKGRDSLMSVLTEKGIQYGIHYPMPIHLQGAYSPLGYGEGDFPVSEKLAKEIISLPMYPELSDRDLETVTDAIREFLAP